MRPKNPENIITGLPCAATIFEASSPFVMKVKMFLSVFLTYVTSLVIRQFN